VELPPIVVVVVHGAGRDAPAAGRNAQLVINYDLPATGREYLRRLTALSDELESSPLVAYTFVEDGQQKTRRGRELVGLLRRGRSAALTEGLGGAGKAAEFDSMLQQLDEEENGDNEEDEEEDEEEGWKDCDCAHCTGCAVGSTSYHVSGPSGLPGTGAPNVEVVRVPLHALEDMDAIAPFIAPRLTDHVCTIISLHCLFLHTPWDGYEHLFAPPGFTGSVRVILVLADGCSWHHYPDQGTLGAGGVGWSDILDVDSMDRSDALLERLVDHEAELLGGHSERVVLMGISQGGGQSMLRFLRSRRRLGGWIGSVCHAPTAPHTPVDRDPLTVSGRPLVNCDRPIRLLSGESDSVFPPGLVARDMARLREAGGFTDVELQVQKGLTHEGFPDEGKLENAPKGEALQRAWRRVPELLFVRKHLPSMIGVASRSPTPDAC